MADPTGTVKVAEAGDDGLRWMDAPGTKPGGPSCARLSVLELGDPGGPPVVLIPGLTDGLHPVFDPGGRRLFDDVPVPMERCRGLVVSYRRPLVGVVGTVGLAEDVAAVLRSVLDRPAVLICHSMGTMVAQHLAAVHPELVAGMVLSAPLLTVDDPLREVVERWSRMVRAGDWDEMALDALRCSYTGDELDRRRDLLAVLAPAEVDGERRDRHLRLAELCLAHEPPDPPGLRNLPTLLLAGELDPVAPPSHARSLAALSPSARLHVLPGLAHGFPEQASSAFSTFVTGFLGEVAGSCASWTGDGIA